MLLPSAAIEFEVSSFQNIVCSAFIFGIYVLYNSNDTRIHHPNIHVLWRIVFDCFECLQIASRILLKNLLNVGNEILLVERK